MCFIIKYIWDVLTLHFSPTVQVLGVPRVRAAGCVDEHGVDLRHPHPVPLYPPLQHLLSENPLALLRHGSLHPRYIQVRTVCVLAGKLASQSISCYVILDYLVFHALFSVAGGFCAGRLSAAPHSLLWRLWVYYNALHELCSGELREERWKLQHPGTAEVQLLPPLLLFWAHHDLR